MNDHRKRRRVLRILVLAIAVLGSLAADARAKSYFAERFDTRVEVLRGGSLRVTETVVFRFEGGAFTTVFRQLPTRKTDGVQIERVAMDDQPFTRRDGPGGYTLEQKNGRQVLWHFDPVTDSSHVFELTYLVRGVVWQDADADIVAWKPLPTEHKYRIDAATTELILPAPPLGPPTVEIRRGRPGMTTLDNQRVVIDATDLRSNGWIEATVRLPRGSVITSPPQWQQRQQAAAALAPTWLSIAALILLAGLAALFAMRQGYAAPPPQSDPVPNGPARPDRLPPALAGALVSNGRSSLEHAMAALFALAERGEVRITERPRKFLQHDYTLERAGSRQPLLPHEQAVLDIAFTGKHPETQASLTTARGRLARRQSRFSKAVREELAGAGLLDAGRQAVRTRYRNLAILTLCLAGAAGVVTGILSSRYAAWPVAIVGALVIVGVAALIAYAGHTPLSDEGVRRARDWRGLRQYMKDLAGDRTVAPGGVAASLLPFAVAVGLAGAWAKYLKVHPSEVPDWFSAIDVADRGQAFSTFIATGGSGAGHGAGGAGGAAGGGASGAH